MTRAALGPILARHAVRQSRPASEILPFTRAGNGGTRFRGPAASAYTTAPWPER